MTNRVPVAVFAEINKGLNKDGLQAEVVGIHDGYAGRIVEFNIVPLTIEEQSG